MTELESFLSTDLRSGDEIFRRFASLPGAVVCTGEKPLQRFVYVPGSRENRVLLNAHADTVWDNAYANPQTAVISYADGVYASANPACGIGADDRAGCALLWELRHSGHSLLLTDGEEKGKQGAKFLRKHKKLMREINTHSFILALDAPGNGQCLYNQVDHTPAFMEYITDKLGFTEGPGKGGCDLQYLCHKICGVNISVGYENCHRPQERLVVAHWYNTLEKLTAFLMQDHPRFPIHKGKRLLSLLGKIKWYAARALKKLTK